MTIESVPNTNHRTFVSDMAYFKNNSNVKELYILLYCGDPVIKNPIHWGLHKMAAILQTTL